MDKFLGRFDEKLELHKKYSETCEDVLSLICRKTGFNKDVLKGKLRITELVYARYSYYKYCKTKHPEIPNEIIAGMLNRREPTMANGLKKINREMELIKYYKYLKLE